MTTTVYTRDHRPPVVQSKVWLEVMARADWRCQCVGQCGRGRGHITGVVPIPPQASIFQLAVAPLEPGISEVAACRVNAEYLQAWCGPCLDATVRGVRAARRAAEDVRDTQPELLSEWSL